MPHLRVAMHRVTMPRGTMPHLRVTMPRETMPRVTMPRMTLRPFWREDGCTLGTSKLSGVPGFTQLCYCPTNA